tara:strand:- start:43 stop:474 length:432 start_codon:yes stop_codon:yes gene_type:complete
MELNNNKKIAPLKPVNIRTCWEDIKPGIVEILEQDKFPTIRPEEVYSECVNGRAFLYTSEDGFVILSLEDCKYTQDKTLLIWFGHAHKTGASLWVSHKEWFNNFAKELECNYIEARTKTDKLNSYFLQTGWELETRVFKKQVI